MNYLLMITSSKIQNSQFDTCNNLDINNNLSKLAMKVNHQMEAQDISLAPNEHFGEQISTKGTGECKKI